LILLFCGNLVEVHCSVGLLDKLVVLNLYSCYNLTILPRSFRLRSLERLDLTFCRMLKTFPEIEFPMEVLEFIGLEFTGIEELPSSIGYLVGLKQLRLSGCSDLTNLPHTIYKLQHLKELNLRHCNGLQEILRLPPNVVEVQASRCVSLAIFLEEPRRSQLLNTWDPPRPVGVRTASSALQSSSLGNNVVTESDFLIERDCPRNLKVLNLSHSAIVSLPTWLNRFVRLEELCLSHCQKLEEIPELPPNIKNVCANGCTSLERFQYNNINDLPMLEWIEFSDCHRLRENMGDDLQIRLMSEVHIYIHIYTCWCLTLFVGFIIENLSYPCNRDILRNVNLAVYFREIRFQIASANVKRFHILIGVKLISMSLYIWIWRIQYLHSLLLLKQRM
jgi:hypothetical protein